MIQITEQRVTLTFCGVTFYCQEKNGRIDEIMWMEDADGNLIYPPKAMQEFFLSQKEFQQLTKETK